MLNTVPIIPGKLFNCLATLYRLRYPAYLAGPPGIGKSAVVRQFAEQHNLRLITVMLSQIEPSDLRGLPFLDRELGRTRWLVPEFYPDSDDDSGGILFLDELANAEPRIQVAAYQLLLDRCIGEYRLPSKWVCFAAGNRLEDNTNVFEISAALADRLVFFNVNCEARDWLIWARQHQIAPEVLTFIQVKPDFLEGNQMQEKIDQLIVPTPRSWERVSNILKAESDSEVRQYLISGVIGQAACVQFFHVMTEVQELPNIEDLLAADRKTLPYLLPKTIAGLYGLTYSLVAYCNDLPTMQRACVIFSELDQVDATLPGAEVQTLAFEILLEKAEKMGIFLQLVTTPEYVEYNRKAKEFFSIVNSQFEKTGE